MRLKETPKDDSDKKISGAYTAMRAADEAEKLYSEWEAEAQSLSAEYPDFLLADYAKNSEFLKLIGAGVSIKRAYESLNLEGAREQIAKNAAKRAREETLSMIRMRALRADENCASVGSAAVTKSGVYNMTRKERAEIAHKALRGQNVTL